MFTVVIRLVIDANKCVCCINPCYSGTLCLAERHDVWNAAVKRLFVVRWMAKDVRSKDLVRARPCIFK